jgi:multidrug resistance efflux pump
MTTKLPGEIGGQAAPIEDGNGVSQRSVLQRVRQGRLKVVLSVVAIVALLGAAYGGFRYFSAQSEDLNIVRVSGRIESPETYIAAPTATRIKSVAVKEGDAVRKGQLIVTLDSENLQKRITDSAPALKAALHARRETDVQIAAVQTEIGEARAKSHGFLAKIFSTKSGREKKETQLRSEMLQAQMMSMQARSAVASVQSARTQASSKLSYFNITSPIEGKCTVRSAEPGELVSAGRVMLTLVGLNSAYMRGFVPESDIARIKIGQAAKVFLDSDETKPLSGRVTAIDDKPSFTPENIYFKKDRVRQAFGINISIDHSNGLAKPGMPADARIVLNSKNEKKE